MARETPRGVYVVFVVLAALYAGPTALWLLGAAQVPPPFLMLQWTVLLHAVAVAFASCNAAALGATVVLSSNVVFTMTPVPAEAFQSWPFLTSFVALMLIFREVEVRAEAQRRQDREWRYRAPRWMGPKLLAA
jgi:hypothetical protein